MTSDQWGTIRRTSISLLALTTAIVSTILYSVSYTDLSGSLAIILMAIPVSLFCVASFAAYAEDHVGSRLPILGILATLIIYLIMLSGTILETTTDFSENIFLLRKCIKIGAPVLFIAFSVAVMTPRLHTKYQGIRLVTYIPGLAIAFISLLNGCTKQSEEFFSASLVVVALLGIFLILFSLLFVLFYLKCRKDFR